ncbi:MAG: hypothetical protein HY731_04060, partial [Candidatus Tectomicrobia bacterium]|nr:hypothetical protein [Candidatus Tectomicrobia bacterium]
MVSIKEFLGHESMASSERYARLSNQQIKQVYVQAIKKVVQKSKVLLERATTRWGEQDMDEETF